MSLPDIVEMSLDYLEKGGGSDYSPHRSLLLDVVLDI